MQSPLQANAALAHNKSVIKSIPLIDFSETKNKKIAFI